MEEFFFFLFSVFCFFFFFDFIAFVKHSGVDFMATLGSGHFIAQRQCEKIFGENRKWETIWQVNYRRLKTRVESQRHKRAAETGSRVSRETDEINAIYRPCPQINFPLQEAFFWLQHFQHKNIYIMKNFTMLSKFRQWPPADRTNKWKAASDRDPINQRRRAAFRHRDAPLTNDFSFRFNHFADSRSDNRLDLMADQSIRWFRRSWSIKRLIFNRRRQRHLWTTGDNIKKFFFLSFFFHFIDSIWLADQSVRWLRRAWSIN